jgi:hypothetical protein
MPTRSKFAGPPKQSPPKHNAPGRPPIAREPESVRRARTASVPRSKMPHHESVRATERGEEESRGRAPKRRNVKAAGSSVRTDLGDSGRNSGAGSDLGVQRNELAPLEICDWVPRPVASLAQTLYAEARLRPGILDRYADAVHRLATDQRMRKVWREITRRKGGAARAGDYDHPASERMVRGSPRFRSVEHLSKKLEDRDRLQEQAAALLFIEAACLFVWDQRLQVGPVVRTKREVNKQNDILRELATRYEADAARLESLGDWLACLPRYWIVQEAGTPQEGQVFVPASVLLRALAAGALQQIRRTTPDDPWLVERRSNRVGDDWVRGLIISLGQTCEALFGRRLLGTIVTLANVALGRTDITKGEVQGVLGRTR